MRVTKHNYPRLHRAFDLVEMDNGMPSSPGYDVPETIGAARLHAAEQALAGLTDEELDTVCTGYELEQDAIVQRSDDLKAAFALLNLFFDGWP